MVVGKTCLPKASGTSPGIRGSHAHPLPDYSSASAGLSVFLTAQRPARMIRHPLPAKARDEAGDTKTGPLRRQDAQLVGISSRHCRVCSAGRNPETHRQVAGVPGKADADTGTAAALRTGGPWEPGPKTDLLCALLCLLLTTADRAGGILWSCVCSGSESSSHLPDITQLEDGGSGKGGDVMSAMKGFNELV